MKKLAAVILAAMMVLGLGTILPAAAEAHEIEYIYVELQLTNNAREKAGDMPAHPAEFEVVPASGGATYTHTVGSTSSTYNVLEGVEGGLTINSDSEQQISFAKGEIGHEAGTKKAKVLKVNPGVFPTPGIYRYKLSEKIGSQPGFTYNTEGIDYYIDLFISAGADKAKFCETTVAHRSDSTALNAYSSGASNEVETKARMLIFRDTYDTHFVKLTKKLDGNQRVDTDLFEFKVELSNITPVDGRTITVEAVKDNVPTDYELEAKTAALAQEGIILGDYDYIKIHGLYKGETAKIIELSDNAAGASATGKGYESKLSTDSEYGATGAGYSVEKSIDTTSPKDIELELTNRKNGNVPTGIFVNYLPFWIMGIVAVVLAFFFFGRRRNRLTDDI